MMVPFFHTQDEHAQLLMRIFCRILATKTAEDSFAMLMDNRLTIEALTACRLLRINDL